MGFTCAMLPLSLIALLRLLARGMAPAFEEA